MRLKDGGDGGSDGGGGVISNSHHPIEAPNSSRFVVVCYRINPSYFSIGFAEHPATLPLSLSFFSPVIIHRS